MLLRRTVINVGEILLIRPSSVGFDFGRLISKSMATSRKHGFKAIVVSGPSGGGKSTLVNKLFQNYPDSFAFSVSRKFFCWDPGCWDPWALMGTLGPSAP